MAECMELLTNVSHAVKYVELLKEYLEQQKNNLNDAEALNRTPNVDFVRKSVVPVLDTLNSLVVSCNSICDSFVSTYKKSLTDLLQDEYKDVKSWADIPVDNEPHTESWSTVAGKNTKSSFSCNVAKDILYMTAPLESVSLSDNSMLTVKLLTVTSDYVLPIGVLAFNKKTNMFVMRLRDGTDDDSFVRVPRNSRVYTTDNRRDNEDLTKRWQRFDTRRIKVSHDAPINPYNFYIDAACARQLNNHRDKHTTPYEAHKYRVFRPYPSEYHADEEDNDRRIFKWRGYSVFRCPRYGDSMDLEDIVVNNKVRDAADLLQWAVWLCVYGIVHSHHE